MNNILNFLEPYITTALPLIIFIEIKFDNITIQVVKFKRILIPTKIKTYSNYFKYLENKKQDANYQVIIKDIAIGGYEFSKKITIYKLFWIICSFICISTLIFPVFTIFYNNNYTIVSFSLLLFITLAWLMCIVSIYFLLCKSGYGSTKAVGSDCFIYNYPSEFKYITLQEDKKYIQTDYKILLNIKFDLSNPENLKVNIQPQNIFYIIFTKLFPLNN